MDADTKVINVTDGYDSSGVAIPAQNNLVPATATASTVNHTGGGNTGSVHVNIDVTGFDAPAPPVPNVGN